MLRNTLIWQPLMKSKRNDYNLNIHAMSIRLKKKNQLIWFMSEMTSRRYDKNKQVLEKELLEAISSLQTTPENEAWLQGALEVFKHE